MGWFSLSIDTNPARTILPTAPDIKTYKLSFVPNASGVNGNTEFALYRTPGNLNAPVLLNAGRWDLIVTAYTDEGGEADPPEVNVASGSFPNDLLIPGTGFLIGDGGVTGGEVTLKPIAGGKGAFRWTIKYPDDLPAGVAITSAQMNIEPFAGGAAEPTITLTGASTSTDTLLDAGYYRVNITLKSNNAAGSDEKTASLMQILHIYTNMVTEYTRTFTASNFSGTLTGDVTIDATANDGTAVLGKTLTANTDDLGGDDGTIYYQWKRNGENIPGERNQTYAVKPYIGMPEMKR